MTLWNICEPCIGAVCALPAFLIILAISMVRVRAESFEYQVYHTPEDNKISECSGECGMVNSTETNA
jgi:hypothetical protein